MRTTECPYTDGYHFESDSGKSIQMKVIWEIANRVLMQIVSELPEEAQTHDVVTKVLNEAEMQLRGAKIIL